MCSFVGVFFWDVVSTRLMEPQANTSIAHAAQETAIVKVPKSMTKPLAGRPVRTGSGPPHWLEASQEPSGVSSAAAGRHSGVVEGRGLTWVGARRKT